MENLSFEDSLKELEDIVNKLERGDIPLDDAIEEFKKAMDLVKACDDKLKDAQDMNKQSSAALPKAAMEALLGMKK